MQPTCWQYRQQAQALAGRGFGGLVREAFGKAGSGRMRSGISGHRLATGAAITLLAGLWLSPAGAQLRLTPGDVPQSALETPTVRPAPKRADGANRKAKTTRDQTQASLNGEAPAAGEQVPPAAGNFPRRLPQAELKTRFFNGVPIISRGRGSTALFTLVFNKDGVIERTDAKGDKVTGKWKFAGDAYCSRWTGEKKDTCYTVVEDGEIIKIVFFTRAVATWALSGTPPSP